MTVILIMKLLVGTQKIMQNEVIMREQMLRMKIFTQHVKGNVHGNFEWFGLGTSSNVNNGNVVSYNSANSERDMESLSFESEEW